MFHTSFVKDKAVTVAPPAAGAEKALPKAKIKREWHIPFFGKKDS